MSFSKALNEALNECQCDLTTSLSCLLKIYSAKRVRTLKCWRVQDKCLWTVFFFFLHNSKRTESFSSSARLHWQLWKSLAAALPDWGSALWSRRMCSAFPLQYLIRERDTCSHLATERVRSSGEWLMPHPFVVGVLFLTHGAQNWAKPFREQLYCPRNFGSGATIIHFFMLQGAFFGVFFMKDSTGKYREMF